jgi:hypothetical protein
MKNILFKIKSRIKGKLRKIMGIEDLNRRMAQLEEITTNMDIGMQVENGLRYLKHIQSTSIADNTNKQD